MMELFQGHASAYGRYRISGGIREDGKVRGKGETIRADVSETLWDAHLCGQAGLGVVPISEESQCRFGAVDIDDYTLEHGGNDARGRIIKTIDSHKMPLVPVRSKSGGLHLYLFTTEWVDAEQMQGKLREMASFLGFGSCEIFPKQTQILKERGDIGQWINMPYFDAEHSDRHAFGPRLVKLEIKDFLKIARQRAITPRNLALFKCSVSEDALPQGPPCLQVLTSNGFPPGTRNDGLFSLGVYARKAFPDEWEKKIEEFNLLFMLPPIGPKEVLQTIGSLKKKDYKYPCQRQPIMGCCNAKVCKTRKHGVGQTDFPMLANLARFESDPVIWFLDVEDKGRLELRTEDLQSPFKFQRRCIELLGIMPAVPSQSVWLVIINELMQNVTSIPVPTEATPKGQLKQMLEEFLKIRPQAESPEWLLRAHILRQDDYYYFRLSDFLAYLQRQRFDWSLSKVASALRDLGVESTGMNVLPKRYISLYKIKIFEADTMGHVNVIAEKEKGEII